MATAKRLFKPAALALLMLVMGVAQGALEPLEDVLELGFNDMSLPGHEADQLVVRECGHCEALMLRVSPETIYRVNGMRAEKVTLQQFRAAARRVVDKTNAGLVVGYRPDTNQVTRLVMFTE